MRFSIKQLGLCGVLCAFQSVTSCRIDAQPQAKVTEQIKTLEENGTYPKLDRSADIKGPDQDLNGVRDDIDAWIAAQPITEVQKKAAIQSGQAMQKTLLVDLNDKVALQAIGDEVVLAVRCARDAYDPNRDEGSKINRKIEALTANTKERAARYIAYNRAVSGSVVSASPANVTCK